MDWTNCLTYMYVRTCTLIECKTLVNCIKHVIILWSVSISISICTLHPASMPCGKQPSCMYILLQKQRKDGLRLTHNTTYIYYTYVHAHSAYTVYKRTCYDPIHNCWPALKSVTGRYLSTLLNVSTRNYACASTLL